MAKNGFQITTTLILVLLHTSTITCSFHLSPKLVQFKNHELNHRRCPRIKLTHKNETENNIPVYPSQAAISSRNHGGVEIVSRRSSIRNLVVAAATTVFVGREKADAAVTDESKSFAADTSYDASSLSSFEDFVQKQKSTETNNNVNEITQTQQQEPSDEFVISIPASDVATPGGLGIELAEVAFRTNVRIFINSIRPNSPAERLGIQKGWVLVEILGQGSAERTNAQGVSMMVSRAAAEAATNPAGTVDIRFRDPSVFRDRLQSMSSSSSDASTSVTTQVAPAGDTTQRNFDGSIKRGEVETSQDNQRITVSQLIKPKLCNRGATKDDLLEISYVGRVVETGAIFDGSAVLINGQGIPGRGNDVSMFFVLGKQAFGQFPPGWDVGLEGICVGERRRLIVPPVLAYGSKGVPKRGIPPDATLQYDVTLLSLNGLATPQ